MNIHAAVSYMAQGFHDVTLLYVPETGVIALPVSFLTGLISIPMRVIFTVVNFTAATDMQISEK